MLREFRNYAIYCLVGLIALSGLLYSTKARISHAAEHVPFTADTTTRTYYSNGSEVKLVFPTVTSASKVTSQPFSVVGYNRLTISLYVDSSTTYWINSGGMGVGNYMFLQTGINEQAINSASFADTYVDSPTTASTLQDIMPSFGRYSAKTNGAKYARLVMNASNAIFGPTAWVRLYND